MSRLLTRLALLLLLPVFLPLTASAAGWKAGKAQVAITPKEPIWMAGYGARDHESEGVETDLWVKALALEDPDGQRALLITLDLCGITQPLSNQLRDEIQKKHQLNREQVVLAVSHTHSGPVVGQNLITMYPLNEAQRNRVDEYTKVLHQQILDTADEAMARLAPAKLAWGSGLCDFAVNRRNNDQAQVPELREKLALQGPDDHSVPVLRVANTDGQIQAVVFGYACHNTTLDQYTFNGDYAGYAQMALEEAHPGAQAMFWSGCGGDQNPLPRRSLELARQYGQMLADAVNLVLDSPMRPVKGALRAAYEEIDLAFDEIPPKEKWEELAESDNHYEVGRAKALLKQIEEDGKLSPTYPYPVQLWRVGDDLEWIFLGGEVVVDFSLRIKRNLGSSKTWVAAYCNDVMAYIPSLRVLREGGYEGVGAMLYYGQPAPWAEQVEEDIIDSVARLHRAVNREP